MQWTGDFHAWIQRISEFRASDLTAFFPALCAKAYRYIAVLKEGKLFKEKRVLLGLCVFFALLWIPTLFDAYGSLFHFFFGGLYANPNAYFKPSSLASANASFGDAAMSDSLSEPGSGKWVPKVAFLFLITDSLPMAPFWLKFFEGYEHLYSIYIHAKPNAGIELPPFWQDRLIPRRETEWGTFSLVEAEVFLLYHALQEKQNSRFVLLSPSCAPLHNFSYVYKYLVHSQLSFVDCSAVTGKKRRYKKWFLPEVTINQWRKGSQWFELSRPLAEIIVSDRKFYPKFKKFCSIESNKGCYADEHYLQTTLFILAPSQLANRSVTWASFPKKNVHPLSFGRSDVNAGLIQRMRGGRNCTWNQAPAHFCYLFGRKFEPDTLPVLLDLASYILQ